MQGVKVKVVAGPPARARRACSSACYRLTAWQPECSKVTCRAVSTPTA